MNTIPIQIREKRRQLGLTQQELANQLGVHQVTLANWETGAIHPSLNSLERLEDILDIKCEDEAIQS